MSDQRTKGAARVRMLAAYAALPLPTERESVVAATLDAWLPDANALSEKMSAEEYRDLLPITVLGHPEAEDHGEH